MYSVFYVNLLSSRLCEIMEGGLICRVVVGVKGLAGYQHRWQIVPKLVRNVAVDIFRFLLYSTLKTRIAYKIALWVNIQNTEYH